MSDRYRTYAPADDPPITGGDTGFVGVNSFDVAENLQPGQCQNAVNMDFTTQDPGTRGGFVCLPSLSLSPLTLTWTSRNASADNDWLNVVYANGLFLGVSTTAGVANRMMTSLDAITWTARTVAADYTWFGIAYGAGLYVATSSSGGTTDQVMTSPDAITWTLRTTPHSGTAWFGLTYANGIFVAVGSTGTTTRIMTSTDGINWTSRTPSQASGAWIGVTYGSGVFVAISQTGGLAASLMYSSDGITWTNATASANSTWIRIAYGAGVFVALAAIGANMVMSSPDGITWTTQTAAAANTWEGLVYGGGLFVAVSFDGASRIMVSRDGATWTSQTAAAANQWQGIAYGAGVWAAVANSGVGTRVMTSGQSTLVYASGIYSDPADAGSQWMMLVGPGSVSFNASGRQSRVVSISGYTVSEPSTVVQCNNLVYIFRGSTSTPLYWTGDWSTNFTIAPTPTPAVGFVIIPNSNQAIYYQNRLWVKNGKDTVSASDVLNFDRFDILANSFNTNFGSSDYIVTTYPFGTTTLVIFKNKSVIALTNIQGALGAAVATEVTRQVGAIGINAVVSVGSDLVYMSDRNINLLTLTATNNSLQHKTLPLSSNIQDIIKRVNWTVASKVSMAYWDNKLFVALPLDNSTYCNAVVVYNFVTEQWFGEWNFATAIDMRIQGWLVVSYLGATRLHCVTEDGRIFVTNEGFNDISGTTVAEVTASLTTRAYRMNNENRVSRRMYADLGTNRPSFSITAYTEGASESETNLTAQTYSRSTSWLFNDTTYTLTNANDDYNRAFRQDYSTGPSSIQSGTGFQPEMLQSYRFPLITRRKGRLSWFKIANTQGRIVIQGIGAEARPGDRGNLVQVG